MSSSRQAGCPLTSGKCPAQAFATVRSGSAVKPLEQPCFTRCWTKRSPHGPTGRPAGSIWLKDIDAPIELEADDVDSQQRGFRQGRLWPTKPAGNRWHCFGQAPQMAIWLCLPVPVTIIS